MLWDVKDYENEALVKIQSYSDQEKWIADRSLF
jgi:hypothetical protein